jgi:hypothetical protein
VNTYDLTIEQGATLTVTFEWRADDEEGALIDTDNYEPRMQIRDAPGGTVLGSFSPANGLTADAGVVTLHVGADATAGIQRSGVYDIELHNQTDSADVVRLVQGTVTLNQEVTTT